jgi:hypothetical protein
MEKERRRKIANAQWESHRETIKKLYVEDGKQLKGKDGLMDIMATRHGFLAR